MSAVGGREAWFRVGLVAIVVTAATAYLGLNHAHKHLESRLVGVDPYSAARKSGFYRQYPPAGDLVVLADPTSQTGLPAAKRFWAVAWYSESGQLCAVEARYLATNDAMCVDLDVAQQRRFSAGDDLQPALGTVSDKGFLWVLGAAPPEVVSVTATADAGAQATAKVMAVPGNPNGFFALTLYAADRSLGMVRFEGADASGKVVQVKTVDEWGRGNDDRAR